MMRGAPTETGLRFLDPTADEVAGAAQLASQRSRVGSVDFFRECYNDPLHSSRSADPSIFYKLRVVGVQASAGGPAAILRARGAAPEERIERASIEALRRGCRWVGIA